MTSKTVIILLFMTVLCLILQLCPPPRRDILQGFIALTMVGAVPVLPRGIKPLLNLQPNLYSLGMVCLMPALIMGIYSFYETENTADSLSFMFFLPSCVLLFLIALCLLLHEKATQKQITHFNRICFAAAAIIPLAAFISALLTLFNSFSPYSAMCIFSIVCIYSGICIYFLFCITVTLSILKNN